MYTRFILPFFFFSYLLLGYRTNIKSMCNTQRGKSVPEELRVEYVFFFNGSYKENHTKLLRWKG